MHLILQKHNMLPGDRIVEPKSNLRIVKHHSIYLGQDNYGTDWIAENKIGHGVRVVSANEYFRNLIEITRIERFRGNGSERKAAVERALKEAGKPYNLINYNCEGFANYVQHGVPFSQQAETGVKIVGLIGLAYLIGVLISAE